MNRKNTKSQKKYTLGLQENKLWTTKKKSQEKTPDLYEYKMTMAKQNKAWK